MRSITEAAEAVDRRVEALYTGGEMLDALTMAPVLAGTLMGYEEVAAFCAGVVQEWVEHSARVPTFEGKLALLHGAFLSALLTGYEVAASIAEDDRAGGPES